jgi:GAF domain-containing protein
MDDPLLAAVSAAALDSTEVERALLQAIVEVTRAIFRAQASSIFLLDEASGELVFEAVAGEGAPFLVGQRIPASRGIAGWVLTARQPLIVDDLSQERAFAQDIAESTSYLPHALMAVPLLGGDEPLGVLEVLDWEPELRAWTSELDLLGLFAQQASIALVLVQRSRRARQVLEQRADDLDSLVGIVSALSELQGNRRAAGLRLVDALREILTQDGERLELLG